MNAACPRSRLRTLPRLLSYVALALLSLAGNASQAPSAASLAQVSKIYVEPFAGKRGASEIRGQVIGLLKHNPSLTIVSSADQADAVLKGNGEIWTTGYISTNPRAAESSRNPIYSGFLSLTLEGGNGQALWSYLVTPAGSFSSAITTNLASRGANLLLTAVDREKGSSAGATTTGANAAPANSGRQRLEGAGGTFPAPLYQAWIQTFHQIHPEIEIAYLPVGSEKGIQRLLDQQVDFAASDVADSPPGTNLQRFATVLGAVVPIYNLHPGPERSLHFTPEILAGIYLGKITRWNDPIIRAANRGVNLPDAAIALFHRGDGSGSTYAFTDFLTKTSPEWKSAVGTGSTVRWPAGTEAVGNDGVAVQVKQTPNSIGYVELTYAVQRELSYGAVRNPAGAFVTANLETVGAAARTSLMSADLAVSITNAPGKDAYPIASFTWIVLPALVPEGKKGPIRQMLQWMLTSGQKQSPALGYAPLPHDLAGRELESVSQLK